MSALASPFGLKPALSQSGVIRPWVAGQIQTGYPTNIFQFSPVIIDANGFVTASAAGSRAIGVFQGVEWTDSDGRRRFSNRWTASTAGTDIVAWYSQDPTLVYQIQADATLTLAAIGQQYDWTALAGNSTTGLSSVALGVSTAAANAGLQVLGLVAGPDNAWGDAFPIVLVRISEHQLVADVAGF